MSDGEIGAAAICVCSHAMISHRITVNSYGEVVLICLACRDECGVNQPTSEMIVHLADDPDGPIQKCSRCGYVLTDYTDAVGPVGDWSPGFWEPGVEITVMGTEPVRYLTAGTPSEIARPCNEALH